MEKDWTSCPIHGQKIRSWISPSHRDARVSFRVCINRHDGTHSSFTRTARYRNRHPRWDAVGGEFGVGGKFDNGGEWFFFPFLFVGASSCGGRGPAKHMGKYVRGIPSQAHVFITRSFFVSSPPRFESLPMIIVCID